MDDSCAWIDLVISRAADLRAAGITSIGFNGCSATIGPLPEPLPDRDAKPEPRSDEPDFVGNVFNDPASYPGGVVPGFTIEKLELED